MDNILYPVYPCTGLTKDVFRVLQHIMAYWIVSHGAGGVGESPCKHKLCVCTKGNY